MSALDRLHQLVRTEGANFKRVQVSGAVREVAPGHYRVKGLTSFAKLGDTIGFKTRGAMRVGEAVRIDSAGVTVKPFDGTTDIRVGTRAHIVGELKLSPDHSWRGRVVNALGDPLDEGGPLIVGPKAYSTEAVPPSAMSRQRITTALKTGIRAIDLFTPICIGQRIGIFAGSGVGKSTLLTMLAKCEGFDTIVVALVGERGREVREFLEGPIVESREKCVMVVSTGDESPMMRRQAPKAAMAIAEYFRDQGDSVLLIVDSVTRYAHAARDVALAAGEPAVARGYTPSVFSELPRLLERAGPGQIGGGSITGMFSVLVDGDDHNDPVADNIRGTLDGHIVLDRSIADQGRFPAINVLGSLSRLAELGWQPKQRELIRRIKSLIARFEDSKDLRLMGGYKRGSDAELDQAVVIVPKVYDALRQSPSMPFSQDSFADLAEFLQQPSPAE